MSYLIGLAMGVLAVVGALFFLKQPPSVLFDDVALAVVLGGTIALSVTVLPWNYGREVFRSIFGIVFSSALSDKKLLNQCLSYIDASNNKTAPQVKIGGLPGDILTEGQELIALQFSTEEIEAILQERVHQDGERKREIANSIRSLAKYPPAFGLAGTVLGLVALMRAITEGLETRETGAKMAIALVATLYGLVLANLVVAPLGEAVLRKSVLDHKKALVALQAVLLAAQGVSLLKAQEMLNSHVPKHKRVNVLNNSMDTDMAA